MAKNCCSVVESLKGLFGFAIAILLLALLMNLKKMSLHANTASAGVDFATQKNVDEAADRFIFTCRHEFRNHTEFYRAKRKPHMASPEEYTKVVDEQMETRYKLFVDCLEKMFTLSKDVKGMTLQEFKGQMEGVLNTFTFDNKYSQFKVPANRARLSNAKVKETLYYMLDLVNSFSYQKLKSANKFYTNKNAREVNREFIFDSVENKFGFTGEEVVHSEEMQSEPELQKMFEDAHAKML